MPLPAFGFAGENGSIGMELKIKTRKKKIWVGIALLLLFAGILGYSILPFGNDGLLSVADDPFSTATDGGSGNADGHNTAGDGGSSSVCEDNDDATESSGNSILSSIAALVGGEQEKVNTSETIDSTENIIKENADPEDEILTVKGSALSESYTFTLSELMAMSDGIFTGDYFSRGKEPKTDSNLFRGVKLSYLLASLGIKGDQVKVRIEASDGYSATFSLAEVNALLMNEEVANLALPMILAFSQEGQILDASQGPPLRLVMGQKGEGDYNRQFWVRNVTTITVE